MENVDTAITDPRLSRSVVLDHLQARRGDAYLLGKGRAGATTGTSGLRGHCVYDRATWRVWASGCPFDRLAALSGRQEDVLHLPPLDGDAPAPVAALAITIGGEQCLDIVEYAVSQAPDRIVAMVVPRACLDGDTLRAAVADALACSIRNAGAMTPLIDARVVNRITYSRERIDNLCVIGGAERQASQPQGAVACFGVLLPGQRPPRARSQEGARRDQRRHLGRLAEPCVTKIGNAQAAANVRMTCARSAFVPTFFSMKVLSRDLGQPATREPVCGVQR